MRGYRCLSVACLLVALAVSGADNVQAADAAQPSKVVTRKVDQLPDPVARINGVAIPAADLKKSISAFMQSPAASQVPPGQEMALYKYLLNQMISGELMYQVAQGTKVADLDKQVDGAFAQVKVRYKNEEELKKDLQAQGLSESDLRSLLRRNLLINAYIDQEIVPKQQVTDAEVKEYFDKNPQKFSKPEQVRASHILIGLDEKSDEAARKKARKQIEEILAKVKAGGDFSKLAQEHSSCPSKAQGGDLGPFGKGMMVKEFEDAAWAMQPGEVSGVVETKFGYHIIKLAERLPAIKQNFEEVKAKIAENMKRSKVMEAVTALLKDTQQKAKIEIFLK